jgi:sulfatase maturation enzyme AslB (radical SAM superfamily)
MRVTESFERSSLRLDDVKRAIAAAAQKGVEAISFTGGETFLYFDDLIEMLTFARDAGIEYTRTGTNGFMFMNSDSGDFEKRIAKIAEALAATKIRNFWISIDSADPALHEAMRGLPGVIKGIEKALPIFNQYGIYPSANLGINRNTGGVPETRGNENDPEEFYRTYRRAFQKFYSFVADLGFTIVNACYPMSINDDETALSAVYGATSANDIIHFSRQEHVLLFKALFDTIPEFRSKVRIFSPRTSLYALIRQYSGEVGCSQPCRGGIDYFFVEAKTGNTFPCGYRGHENFGKFEDLDLKKIDTRAFCRQCDWECFRDPSELLGNLLALRKKPLSEISKLIRDSEYRDLLISDLKYYQACDYFDGRLAPDFARLADWQRETADTARIAVAQTGQQ